MRFASFSIAPALFLAMAGQAVAQASHYETSAPPVEMLDHSSHPNVGGFGRIFPLYDGTPSPLNSVEDVNGVVHYLLEHPSHRVELVRLAEKMIADGTEIGTMPLAYVFLAQFIDHDITLDTVTNFDSLAPGEVPNARTPDLDLDCIYGDGREAWPFLYDGPYLRVGAPIVDHENPLLVRYDLLRLPEPAALNMAMTTGPRRPNTRAIIGDPRNDENFVVSQMQAAFIAYHNRMVDRVIEEHLAESREQSQSLIEVLSDAKTVIEEGIDGERQIAEVLDYLRGLSGASSAAVRFAQMQSSEVLFSQAKRVEGLSTFAAVGDDPTASDVLIGALALVDVALEETNTEIASLKADLLRDPAVVEEVFETARDLTIHHYHRVIMEDFLPRIISGDRVLDMVGKGRNFYFPHGFEADDGPFIPIEFSVAAYRFAHSQVPGRFNIRGDTWSALFEAGANEVGDLLPHGFAPVRTETNVQEASDGKTVLTDASLAVDWGNLLNVADVNAALENALKIDTILSTPLETLDIPGVTPTGALGNLAARNLSRGRTYRLPSGQDLARVITRVLERQGSLAAYTSVTGSDDWLVPADDNTKEALITDETPLWYYILHEASCFETGEQRSGVPMKIARVGGTEDASACGQSGTGNVLGPVGGTLVGEVIWGLVDHYRVSTGAGIDLNVSFAYDCEANEMTTCGLGVSGAEELETSLSVTADGNDERYMLRNFLYDAGVAYEIMENDVCKGPAWLPGSSC
jgi:hypothetical protein